MHDLLKSLSFKLFRLGQRFGINIAPNHYYVPLADLANLERTREKWAKPSQMPGVFTDLDSQAAALKEMVLPYRDEYAANVAYREATEGHFGPGYGPTEAQALHGFLRHVKPRRIVEVGSGVSTYCMLRAIENHEAEIHCIEPHPSDFLRAAGVTLNETVVEHVEPGFFDMLAPGDFLFIDSSHAVRPCGDVIFLYLEVLPRLRPGVFVHIHDIYFPYTYGPDVLDSYMQWSETALLQALLVGNERLKVLFSLSMLHYGRPKVLADLFPGYEPRPSKDGLFTVGADQGHFPASTFLVTG